MRGLVIEKPGVLRLRDDLPMPVIGDHQALCRNVACGICNGTDLKLLTGGLRDFARYPCVLGHEAVGEVIEVGAKVRSFHVGDRVLRSSLPDLPDVYSRWGGFAEYGVVDDYDACIADGVPAHIDLSTRQVIPADIDPVDAVMIITLKEVAGALARLDLQPGMDVAVVGCGPVGLAMVSLSRQMGARRVVLAGHHEDRLRAAERLGADAAFNTKQVDTVQALRSMFPQGLDLFIDCVGRAQIIDQGMQVVKEEGKIALYGIGLHTGDRIDWDAAPYNFNIHSVQWPIARYERDAHDFVCSLVSEKKLDLREFVSHRLPVEAYAEGFELVRSRAGRKVALVF